MSTEQIYRLKELTDLEFDFHEDQDALELVSLATALMEDVHLIAAAPDMYEALEELVAILKDVRITNQVDSFTIQPAEAALKKARGEQRLIIGDV